MLITNIVCIGLGASIGAIGGILLNSFGKDSKEKQPVLKPIEIKPFNEDKIIKNYEDNDEIKIEEI